MAFGQLPDSTANFLFVTLEQRVTRDGVGICVALSGGGMRATAFHAGVLHTLDGLPRHLAAAKVPLIDGIDVISAVSGGSLTATLYTLTSKGNWDSAAGLSHLRRFLQGNPITATMTSYFWGVATGDRSFKERIAHFVRVVHDNLLRQATFGHLPKEPHLIIVAKNFKNGRDVRFTQLTMRDHPDFPLAKAVAASSAIPVIFNPLIIEKMLIRSDEPQLENQIRGGPTPLFDGGVHDNLAVDPLLTWAVERPGRQRLCDIVLVSDATEIEFDREAAEFDSEISVARRTVGLLMARVVSLQGVFIDAVGGLKDRLFVIKMPARFNGIPATRDLTVSEEGELIDAGRQEAATVIGNGSVLADRIDRIRKARGWKARP